MGKRGELRIYLGAAPGVGKTYAMLGEAHRRAGPWHRRRRRAGRDPRPRAGPPRCSTGWRSCPGASVDAPRGDADRARRRRRARPPSRRSCWSTSSPTPTRPARGNPKRWQDVEDILDAGITVLTTLNVQHLESLNDVIERITGVRQQETVPDEVVRRAEQVELVDITPEALRRRLAHGNVYAPEKVDAAMANYFQPRNLTALREMALLWLADQVEVALQRYRDRPATTDIWETRERVVVALTGGPESETVLRRAARIAEAVRLGGAVRRARAARRRPRRRPGRRRWPGCGGSPRTSAPRSTPSSATTCPTALLDFARGVDATQLVLGTSRRSRLARVLVEGIGTQVVQDSGHIDVHMVTHTEAGRGLRLPRRFSAVPVEPPGRRAGRWACRCPGARRRDRRARPRVLGLSTDVVLFFLATVVVALVGGLGPALLAAVAGGLLLNFFLTPPLYTFTISERENVITLVVDGAGRRARRAGGRPGRPAGPAGRGGPRRGRPARVVLPDGARPRPDPLPRLLERVREAFGLTTVAILQRHDGQWVVSACSGPPRLRPARAGRRRRRGRARRAPRRPRPDPAGRRPAAARSGRRPGPARAAQPADRRPRPPRPAAAPTPVELRTRAAVGRRARPAHTADVDQGRGREPARRRHCRLSDDDRTELAATIEESADRLTGVVNNLLDSSRIATGAVTPELRRSRYDEVAAARAARARRRRPASGSRSTSDCPRCSPTPACSSGSSPTSSTTRCATAGAPGHAARQRPRRHASSCGSSTPDRACLRGQAERLFAPFQRLGDRDHNGLGLGLSVARGFTDGHGRHAHRRGHTRRRAHRRGRPARGVVVTAVLVVDDDTQLLRALRIHLTARGYEVLTAVERPAALRVAGRARARRRSSSTWDCPTSTAPR